MSNALSSFQEKFKDRMTIVGKDGVSGLLNKACFPIKNGETTTHINNSKIFKNQVNDKQKSKIMLVDNSNKSNNQKTGMYDNSFHSNRNNIENNSKGLNDYHKEKENKFDSISNYEKQNKQSPIFIRKNSFKSFHSDLSAKKQQDGNGRLISNSANLFNNVGNNVLNIEKGKQSFMNKNSKSSLQSPNKPTNVNKSIYKNSDLREFNSRREGSAHRNNSKNALIKIDEEKEGLDDSYKPKIMVDKVINSNYGSLMYPSISNQMVKDARNQANMYFDYQGELNKIENNNYNNKNHYNKNQNSQHLFHSDSNNLNFMNNNNLHNSNPYIHIQQNRNCHDDEFEMHNKLSNNSKYFSVLNSTKFNKGTTSSLSTGGYKPYSVKDYTELSRGFDKINTTSLGANIGSDEWNDRYLKMSKLKEYGNSVQNLNKQNIKKRIEDVRDIVEKERRDKIENSKRVKAVEYSLNTRYSNRIGSPSQELHLRPSSRIMSNDKNLFKPNKFSIEPSQREELLNDYYESKDYKFNTKEFANNYIEDQEIFGQDKIEIDDIEDLSDVRHKYKDRLNQIKLGMNS